MTYAQWKRMKWYQKGFWAPIVSVTEAWRILTLERTFNVYAKSDSLYVINARITCAWDRRIRAQTNRSGWGQLIAQRA